MTRGNPMHSAHCMRYYDGENGENFLSNGDFNLILRCPLNVYIHQQHTSVQTFSHTKSAPSNSCTVTY